MQRHDDSMQALGTSLKAVRGATAELTTQLRRLTQSGTATRRRIVSACSGGTCSGGSATEAPLAAGRRTGEQSRSGIQSTLGREIESNLSRTVSTSLAGVLRNVLGGLTRTLTGLVTRSTGGGLFGGLLGGLVGGGLNLLVDKLFTRHRKVQVENTIQAEVLNFPRLSDLDLATNPASRLLGGRSVPRGPAFTVTVDYRSGAEDIVTAKVAGRLADLNDLHGVR